VLGSIMSLGEPAANLSAPSAQPGIQTDLRRSRKRARVAVVAFVVVAEIAWVGAIAWGVWWLWQMLGL
jgi:hypothetical protein